MDCRWYTFMFRDADGRVVYLGCDRSLRGVAPWVLLWQDRYRESEPSAIHRWLREQGTEMPQPVLVGSPPMGRTEAEELATIMRGLAIGETDEAKAAFVQCAQSAANVPPGEAFRDLVARALTEGWGRSADLSPLAAFLFMTGEQGHAAVLVSTPAGRDMCRAAERLVDDEMHRRVALAARGVSVATLHDDVISLREALRQSPG